jgi:translation initiation factor IF-1
MSKEDHIQLEGRVVQCGAGGIFRVKTENGHEVVARLSGKMRQNKIRVVLGDEVIVGVSPYDPSKGLINFRKK